MTTFYLIRHGTNDLVGNSIAGWSPGVHLNAEGRHEAETLAEALATIPFTRLICSPLERARETAEPLAGRLGLAVEFSEAIGEIRFGDWTGQRFDHLKPDPQWQVWNHVRSRARAPNGESMVEVQARVTGCLAQVAERSPDQTVAVFSHGDPIRSALMFYLGMPMDFVHRIEISPASVSVVKLGAGQPQVLAVNVLPGRKPGFVS